MTVFEIKSGQSAKIKKLNFDSTKIFRRMCDFGIYEGQKITMLKKSVLGKVVLVGVNGFALSLRKDIAQKIEVYIG